MAVIMTRQGFKYFRVPLWVNKLTFRWDCPFTLQSGVLPRLTSELKC